MTGSDLAKRLRVRGIYLYFQEMKRQRKLEAFLAECDQHELTLGVDQALFQLGHDHFRKAMDAVGPECPACPEPDE